jgi:hypothetical protein
MISGIKAPGTQLVREAEELVRSSSSALLYNHVMRCYWFAELFARQEGSKADRELMFLSATLHDLGFTEHGRGSHRFEIEGAHAARRFLKDRGVPDVRSWQVWSTIALHTWDINLYKEDEARLVELGILYDVKGLPNVKLDPADVAEIVKRYPRLGFKREFYALLCEELDAKQPYHHVNHICTCIAHNRSPMTMPDGQATLNGAPFDE